MDDKKKTNISRFIVIMLFASFSFVYAMANMGYYEYQNHRRL